MKQKIAAVIAALLLCSGTAAFAQNTPATAPDSTQPQAGSSATPGQTQGAIDMLKNMTPEQRQQMMQSGMDQVQNLTPDQIKQSKAMYDSMTPEQKQLLQTQIMQQLQNNPQLKDEAEKKLQSLTPAQQQQLQGSGQ